MAFRPLQRLVRSPSLRRCVSSDSSQQFMESDRVLLRRVRNPAQTILSEPLNASKTIDSHHGIVDHAAIINKRPRDIIKSHSGKEFRLSHPTLEEYITNVQRLVTPVYPIDAAAIVSLLDIHVTPGQSPPFQIFEAGTGHGSLSIALSRAISAGNGHLPEITPENRHQRGAILHTLDRNEKYSQRAQSVVAGFRKGMYSRNIEFYTGDAAEWLDTHYAEADGEFLNVVMLDMPEPQQYFAAAAKAMIADAVLGQFSPSVTQIGQSLRKILDDKIPLVLDNVWEFPAGSGAGAGLRKWDVRFAKVRDRVEGPLSTLDAENRPGTVDEADEVDALKVGMVCRPKVGETLVGGGFFATFKKRAEHEYRQVQEPDS